MQKSTVYINSKIITDVFHEQTRRKKNSKKSVIRAQKKHKRPSTVEAAALNRKNAPVPYVSMTYAGSKFSSKPPMERMVTVVKASVMFRRMKGRTKYRI